MCLMARSICSSTQLLPCKMCQRKHDKGNHTPACQPLHPPTYTISCHPLGHHSHSCKGLCIFHICIYYSALTPPERYFFHAMLIQASGSRCIPDFFTEACYNFYQDQVLSEFGISPFVPCGHPSTSLDSSPRKPLSVSWCPVPVPSQTSPKRSNIPHSIPLYSS